MMIAAQLLYLIVGAGVAAATSPQGRLARTPRLALAEMVVMACLWPGLIAFVLTSRMVKPAQMGLFAPIKDAEPEKRAASARSTFSDVPGATPPRSARNKPITSPARKTLISLWFAHFGDRCPVCDCRMHRPKGPGGDPAQATIDHITARALGGDHSLPNLRVICSGCNMDKAKRETQAVNKRRKAAAAITG